MAGNTLDRMPVYYSTHTHTHTIQPPTHVFELGGNPKFIGKGGIEPTARGVR